MEILGKSPTHLAIYHLSTPHERWQLYEFRLVTPDMVAIKDEPIVKLIKIPKQYVNAIENHFKQSPRGIFQSAYGPEVFGHIMYEIKGKVASSERFFPKGKRLKDDPKNIPNTPRFAAFIERECSIHLGKLRPEVTHRSSSMKPEQPRIQMLNAAHLPVGEAVPNEEWNDKLDLLWKKATGKTIPGPWWWPFYNSKWLK